MIRLPRELSSHSAGDKTAEDILGCDTGCGRLPVSPQIQRMASASVLRVVSALPAPSTRRLRQRGDCYTAREGATWG